MTAFMNKRFIIISTFIFLLLSCSRAIKESAPPLPLSKAQSQIQGLVDQFKQSIQRVNNLDIQDSIRIKYSYKFYDLLSNIYIDSIRVHVDSVIIDNLTVSTEFHCNKEIAFKGSLTFLKEMEPNLDSLFAFMKGLKPGSDTIVNFAYAGNHQVRLPNSTGVPIIKVFAYPTPIWRGKKG